MSIEIFQLTNFHSASISIADAILSESSGFGKT